MNQHHKSTSDILQELELVKAAQNNPQHFNVLYEKYFKPVYIFIYRRTLNEELSADLTSQVFLRALINIKKYQYKGVPFSGWLFRIAFNEINMHFRKNKSERIVSIESSGVLQLMQETVKEDNSEALKKMTNALKKLDSTEIQLIELRFFEKHSFAEVGQITGITENNAKVKVYRILDKLKKFMKVLIVWIALIH